MWNILYAVAQGANAGLKLMVGLWEAPALHMHAMHAHYELLKSDTINSYQHKQHQQHIQHSNATYCTKG